MRTPPKSKPQTVRLTIPVSVEVHSTFERLAKASGMPIGRAMGEWLADTLDAVTFMADAMEKARYAPKMVAQELHAYAQGLTDEAGQLMQRLMEKGREDRADADRDGERTPPSNTGVTNINKKT